MSNVISLNEVRIKLAIKDAERVLSNTKLRIIEGEDVPADLIPRLEIIIIELEEQLKRLIEKDY